MAVPLPATIPATEVQLIQSKYVKQAYRISVALPISYRGKPRQRYPAVYLTDANWYFGLVTDLSRVLSRGASLPEAIVVGIGYPVDESPGAIFPPIGPLRLRDMTPVVGRTRDEKSAKQRRADRVETGGASKFLRFIQSQLIPAIDAGYRTRPAHRILAGHSLGGLFALYVLFQQPKLFSGYIAGSPSLWYNDRVTFQHESRFARTHNALPVKLHLAVGELEEEHPQSQMVSQLVQLAAQLESRHYQGFSLTRQILPGCDHGSAIPQTFQAGLQAVLS